MTRQSPQSIVVSEQSEDVNQSIHQALPMYSYDLATEHPRPLCPIDSISPLSVPEPIPPEGTRRQSRLRKRDLKPEPVEKSGLEWRRAKNRAAASKCRAKRGNLVKALQKEYEQTSSQNEYFKRQERVLRELVESLRDCALQHDPVRCRCKLLHDFNILRAEQISQGIIRLGSSSCRG